MHLFSTKPFTDSNWSPSISTFPTFTTTVHRSYDGIVIGIVVTVAVVAIAGAIIVLLVVVLVCKRKATGNTRHHYQPLPSQQDELQQSSTHHSAQPHVDVQTNALYATSATSSRPTWTPSTVVSSPPGYDEAFNYPAPVSMVSTQSPPPYST